MFSCFFVESSCYFCFVVVSLCLCIFDVVLQNKKQKTCVVAFCENELVKSLLVDEA